MKRSTPLTRNIGAKVKYYRKLRGLSQKQLAAQLQTNGCDITETMLGHIETGYRSTSIFEIDKLAGVESGLQRPVCPGLTARYGEISAPCRFASGHPLSRATV